MKGQNNVEQKRKTVRGICYVLMGAFFWGTLPIFSKFLYQSGTTSVVAAAWRSNLAALIFLLWFLVDGTWKKLRWKDIPFYLGMGVVSVGGTFILYMSAMAQLSSAMAAILMYTAPAFVILFNRILFKQRITRGKLMVLLGACVGCALVVRAYDRSALIANWRGMLMGLGSGITYSLTTVFGGRKSSRFSGRENAGLMVLFSPLAFLFVVPPWTLPLPSLSQLGGYLGLAVFGTIMAYVCYMKGLDTGLDGGIASITATIEPVVATLFGALFFQERLELLQIVGMAVVLSSVAAANLLGEKKP